MNADARAINPAELWRVPLEHYRAMIEHGIITEERIELLDSLIHQKAEKTTAHIVALAVLYRELVFALPEGE